MGEERDAEGEDERDAGEDEEVLSLVRICFEDVAEFSILEIEQDRYYL